MTDAARPGLPQLLAILRGQPFALTPDIWPALIEAATDENVLPLLAHRLLTSGFALSGDLREQLSAIQKKAEFSAFIWSETLKGVLAAFQQAGVAAIPLKGPALAQRLYGEAGLRSCGDLDLLAQRSDLAAAEAALRRIGFSPADAADDYHQPWLRDPILLELHHHVDHPLAFDFDLDDAWRRVQPSTFAGQPIRLFAPADELAYLCLHAARHRFDRLYLLVDLALAFRTMPLASAGDFTSSMRNVIALSWLMAARLDPDLPPLLADFTTAADTQRLAGLADRIWQEHLAAPGAKLDWAAQHGFLLEIESPGRDRLRRRACHARILATRLIDADLEFAARWGLQRRWQAHLLRPVRLAIQTVRRPSV